MLEDMHIAEPRKKNAMEEDSFLTPQKERSELDGDKIRNSPPMSPKPYCDTDRGEDDDEEEEEEHDPTDEIKRGTLYASPVIADGSKALKMSAWVLGKMAALPIRHIPSYEREYLYVVQKEGTRVITTKGERRGPIMKSVLKYFVKSQVALNENG